MSIRKALVILGWWLPALLAFGDHKATWADSATASPWLPQASATITQPTGMAWTLWNPAQYALADDGQAIWIGASGGVVRWDKASNTYRRYTLLDGLPHTQVLAVAVDESGNRWFGGDGGLSRLDAAGCWTHFTTANSGLHSNIVDGIAVGADGALWLSHGLPQADITRRNPDGSWVWYPNRETAVSLNYEAILQTRGANRLWTVAGDEVWVDYAVFDGATWQDRTPPDVTQAPTAVAADGAQTVWVLADSVVWHWANAAWTQHRIFLQVTALTIAPDDVVWIGWRGHPYAYSTDTAGVGPLQQSPSDWLNAYGPVTALLADTQGVWAVGPGWLRTPDGRVAYLRDTTAHVEAGAILSDRNRGIWVHSTDVSINLGMLQLFDDLGTTDLADDLWYLRPDPRLDFVTAQARSADGDIWLSGMLVDRTMLPRSPFRLHGDAWIEYAPSYPFCAVDIFIQDARHAWFVSRSTAGCFGGPPAVLQLDDGGTPADQSDDVWQTYPITTAGLGGSVTVDAAGRLWFGDTTGLYRHDGSAWQPVKQPDTEYGICDLVATADGTLLIQTGDTVYAGGGCQQPGQDVQLIRPDGSYDRLSIDQLAERHLDLLRSAEPRNRMWTVAPDGAVWYLFHTGHVWAPGEPQLHRRDAAGVTVYPLPFGIFDVRALEIDRNNHVWLAANGNLWRLARWPESRYWLPLINP